MNYRFDGPVIFRGKRKSLRNFRRTTHHRGTTFGSPHKGGLTGEPSFPLRMITAAFRRRLLADPVSAGSYKGNFTGRPSPRSQQTRGSLDTAMNPATRLDHRFCGIIRDAKTHVNKGETGKTYRKHMIKDIMQTCQ
jgi:hypothetical protein